ncbi:uncharacterized protein LOC105801516 [Gossypium raimondii]|uniref:uncharacterized protein LOC105801516 n=1 Tax=Gossypium raimondii TaxID=29730 RepID=UPI00227BF950|nr:uncharacterized protein LOC105801516 [Gossypium raimondii]
MGGHSGVQVTRKRLSSLIYWKGLTTDVKKWIREYVVCQRFPDRAWSVISMDFIEGLPSSNKKNSILVVVDHLTKYGHFLPLSHPYTATDVANEYLKHVGLAPTQDQLPLVDDQSVLPKEPVHILDRRMVKRGNHAVTEVLVEWVNSFPEDATWEPLPVLSITLVVFVGDNSVLMSSRLRVLVCGNI